MTTEHITIKHSETSVLNVSFKLDVEFGVQYVNVGSLNARPALAFVIGLLITSSLKYRSRCELNCSIMLKFNGYQLGCFNKAVFWAKGGSALSGYTVYLRGGFLHVVDSSSS